MESSDEESEGGSDDVDVEVDIDDEL